ncbi:MAG: preprotein translocase subunit TatB [Propionibacteriales bacterium]|nr:preprotein translocase subunit TatB [Propionibacteriales bacterium]
MSAEPGPEPALVVDCTGMRCPRPIIELSKRFGEIEIGQVIGVVADDPAARADVPAWCRMRDQEYAGERPATDDAALYLVRRIS